MGVIINIGEAKAIRYKQKVVRIRELKRLIHSCEVTYKSLLDIQDSDRVQFTNMVERYKNLFNNELKKLENGV